MCGEFSVFPLLPGEGRLCVLLAQQSEGECSLPCSLGRWSARSPTLERGKPKLSALKRWFLVAVETCPPSSPAPLSPPPPLPRGLPTASSPPNPCAVLHDFR
ncbi:hypothetical protein T4C_13948 [Trichinella pseudospiralis]|uniref:Uncharacterized protein n=1 Tax=Trichinella pseudospiralis TaxID=6337 RepID=A0A0V1JJL0_TRIPS|nr:hypothetical protein T4C_13948 [Trichinella pseudospiralis]